MICNTIAAIVVDFPVPGGPWIMAAWGVFMLEVHMLAQADITLACWSFKLFGMTFAVKREVCFTLRW